MLIKDSYTFIFIYAIVSFCLVIILYSLSYLLSNKLGSVQKLSAYECGFEPISSSQIKFNVKFYLVALLFVIFDLEIIFLFPWSVNVLTLGIFGYYSMLFFLGLLTLGFIYEYKKGAIEW
jgi:NADH-quinone oxidoreductase subunit A